MEADILELFTTRALRRIFNDVTRDPFANLT